MDLFDFDANRRARLHDFDGTEAAVPTEPVELAIPPRGDVPDSRYRRVELPVRPPALRPYQREAYAKFMDRRKGVLLMATGCHAKGQGILMHDGTVRPVEDVSVEDAVMGPDSAPRVVQNLVRGRGRMFRVIPNRGRPFIVNEDHVLTLVQTPRGSWHKDTGGNIVDVTVKDWLGWTKTKKHIHKLFRVGVEFNVAEGRWLPVTPYFLGAFLGDGSGLKSRSPGITTMDQEIMDAAESEAKRFGIRARVGRVRRGNRSLGVILTAGRGGGRPNPLTETLRFLRVWDHDAGTKYIPDRYKTSGRAERLELLAGLLDTDGFMSGAGAEYTSKSEALANDVAFLAASLGFGVTTSRVNKSDQNGRGGLYHITRISGNLDIVPCRVPRKRASIRKSKKVPTRTGFRMEEIGEGDFYGFTLDGDGRYLLGDFTVTHNSGKTIIALHIIRDLGVHTLVLVPTIELAWQWVRAFRKWGGVHAGIWYGERKDVRPVLVMVYNSATILLDDPQEHRLLDRFGLVVFDEIHHAGGEEFGRLLALVDGSRAVLGLTASLREGAAEHIKILHRVPIIFRFGVAEGLNVGAVAPIEVHPVAATMNAMERQEYDHYTGRIKNGMRNLHSHDITAVVRMAQRGGRDGAIAASVLQAITARKMLMAHIEDKRPKALGILREHAGERALVFSEAIEAIEGMETYLKDAGVRVALYHSELPTPVRRMTLEDWGRGFDVLLSVRALDEGIDVPEVGVGILVASGRSERQLVQRIGRIVRPMPGKTAHIYVVHVPGTIEDKVSSGVREIVTRMANGESVDSSVVKIHERG